MNCTYVKTYWQGENDGTPPEIIMFPENDRDRETLEEINEDCPNSIQGAGFDTDGNILHLRVKVQ